MYAILRIEYESFLRESEPIYQSAIHTIFLRKTEIRIDDRSIEESIISRSRFDLEL